MTTHRLIDSALNTSMMVAFAIPGGAPVGAAIAVATFFVDMFFPDSANQPQPAPLTDAQLQTELDRMKTILIDALWKNNADKIIGRLIAIHDEIHDSWKAMKLIQVDGQRFVFTGLDKTTRAWVDGTDTFFVLNNNAGVLTELRGYQAQLTSASLNDPSLTPLQVAEHRTAHTDLYALIESLIFAYLKMAVAWYWGQELLYNRQYADYQAALDDWNGRDGNYQKAHPYNALVASLDAQYPDLHFATYTPKDWNGWLKDPGCPVGLLLQAQQDMVDYCILVPDDGTGQTKPGLYIELRDHWDDFDKQMSAFDSTPASSAGVTLAEMQHAFSQGQKRTVAWDTVLNTYALPHVTEADVDNLGKAVDKWQLVAAQTNFTEVLTKQGDTLLSLSNGDATAAAALYKYNRDQLTSAAAPVPAGLQLKVFPPAALAILDKA